MLLTGNRNGRDGKSGARGSAVADILEKTDDFAGVVAPRGAVTGAADDEKEGGEGTGAPWQKRQALRYAIKRAPEPAPMSEGPR
jgi:hypothetical protein